VTVAVAALSKEITDSRRVSITIERFKYLWWHFVLPQYLPTHTHTSRRAVDALSMM
jgi:hypothetical protein